MSRRQRCAKKSAVRARVARAKVLRRQVRAAGAARAATAATAAAVTLAGAGTAFATPSVRTGTVGEAAVRSGASPVQCPAPRMASSAPGASAAMGEMLFLSASDGVHGRELWKSDGSRAGTVLVKNIKPNDSGYSDSGQSKIPVGGHFISLSADS